MTRSTLVATLIGRSGAIATLLALDQVAKRFDSVSRLVASIASTQPKSDNALRTSRRARLFVISLTMATRLTKTSVCSVNVWAARRCATIYAPQVGSRGATGRSVPFAVEAPLANDTDRVRGHIAPKGPKSIDLSATFPIVTMISDAESTHSSETSRATSAWRRMSS